MNILITGGAGFIANKLIRKLVALKSVCVNGKEKEINEIHAIDLFSPQKTVDGVIYYQVSLNDEKLISDLVSKIKPDVVVHLAAVVSSAAEQDFDLGMRVNIDGTRILLEACRELDSTPRFIFSSSVAVFSGVSCILDSTTAVPTSTYGMTKIVGEYLVNEYSRKRYISGIAVRLPTITVRPGKPNKAASSFVSSIIREPLNGEQTTCPVSPDLSVWISSPKVIVDNLIYAISIEEERISTTINLPGLSVTVADMVSAMENFGGNADLICWEEDEGINRIVSDWPNKMITSNALDLGFKSDTAISAIIASYIEDENIQVSMKK
ncbi:NAD-dependent epimerase/dehydratase family protein [Vibrio sp. SA48]|uniref:D-erythronate dehydrogenase n=1 Tax=Vibrio sp. S12_S33 TaxID=2720223 RepID=UPI00177D0BE9|nr:D-erythronate dehydrogenase [Vibrio sp. S12_S33]MBD1566180.1 NAD-dependent epimerase/dehydratase family protein [Vibrio sp. S12_S33]